MKNTIQDKFDRLVVVATAEEAKHARQRFPGARIIITGVGGVNVLRKLKNLPKRTKITNYGMAGSNNIPVGTEVRVGSSQLYHPNVDYDEPVFALDGDIPCYTSNDFVLQTDIDEPAVFDMELAYIVAMGFKDVEAIKVVSDNLSLTEYEMMIK